MSKKRKQNRQVSLADIPEASLLRTDLRASEREFNPDYSDVIKDLKRIGSLAGFFLALLVVLTFFLR